MARSPSKPKQIVKQRNVWLNPLDEQVCAVVVKGGKKNPGWHVDSQVALQRRAGNTNASGKVITASVAKDVWDELPTGSK